jgi:hypothetical protein
MPVQYRNRHRIAGERMDNLRNRPCSRHAWLCLWPTARALRPEASGQAVSRDSRAARLDTARTNRRSAVNPRGHKSVARALRELPSQAAARSHIPAAERPHYGRSHACNRVAPQFRIAPIRSLTMRPAGVMSGGISQNTRSSISSAHVAATFAIGGATAPLALAPPDCLIVTFCPGTRDL